MTKVDYIIVGCGLAGIAFCEQLRTHNKSFVVYDNSSQQSSVVAAGLYNPVILKRFSEVWKAKEQLELLGPYYASLEALLKVKLDYKFSILRKFTSVEEQNLWYQASDKPNLEPYLDTTLIHNANPSINADFSFGAVKHAGRIDTKCLIDNYKKFLKKSGRLLVEDFKHNTLKLDQGLVRYNTIEASKIIFSEGFGLKRNPFFKYLPLNGTKGEVLTILSEDLKLTEAIKSSIFVIPLGENKYKVGATYNWDDKTNLPTDKAKEELVSKLKTLINCDFKIIGHAAGIRPTVKDRRPLIGRHYQFKNMYVLNGLGTRGVMISPYVSEQLYQFIENNRPLESEINSDRFKI